MTQDPVSQTPAPDRTGLHNHRHARTRSVVAHTTGVVKARQKGLGCWWKASMLPGESRSNPSLLACCMLLDVAVRRGQPVPGQIPPCGGNARQALEAPYGDALIVIDRS